MPFGDYEDFDSCVASNSDKQDPEAYCAAIKRKVEGESSLSESEQKALEASKCDAGFVEINGECKPIEHVEDISPGSLKNSIFQLSDIDTEPIERREEGDNSVRYTNIKLLSPGVWTDSASRESIWYSPRGMQNLEIADENVVNIMHDAENEVSAAGQIDPETVEAGENGVYADIVLDTSNTAGQYADENLQKTLETDGAKGFGGPSVEIAAEGQEIEFNAEKGMKELVGGIIDGLGLVKNPASKPVSFARQTAQRGVALSGDQTVMQLESESGDMASDNKAKILEAVATRELQMDDIQDDAQAIADELEVPIDEVMEVLDPLIDEAEEGDEPPEEEMADDEDEEDEEDDEEETEMEGEDMQVIQEQIDDLWGEIEELKESMMSESELSEELEAAKSELADAETVSELESAKEELDKRLSSLEDEPDKDRTLADNGDGWDPVYDSTPAEQSNW